MAPLQVLNDPRPRELRAYLLGEAACLGREPEAHASVETTRLDSIL